MMHLYPFDHPQPNGTHHTLLPDHLPRRQDLPAESSFYFRLGFGCPLGLQGNKSAPFRRGFVDYSNFETCYMQISFGAELCSGGNGDIASVERKAD